MNDQFTVALVHQAGRVFHRAGTMEVADSEPVRVQEFDNLEQAKEYCARIVRENPAFKCLVYRWEDKVRESGTIDRSEEKVIENANTAWVSGEEMRLRTAHVLVKRQSAFKAVGWLEAGVIGFLLVLPGAFHFALMAAFGLVGLNLFLIAGTSFASPRNYLALIAEETIGTTNPRIARAVCAIGAIVGLLLLAYALYSIYLLASSRT